MAGGKEGGLKIEAGEVGQVKAQRRNIYFQRLIGRAIEDYDDAPASTLRKVRTKWMT